jgi:hypothetical protein
VISRENVASYLGDQMFEVLLNTGNYFVHRDRYLEVFDPSTNPVTSDSIYMAYNWLRAGRRIKVVPGLRYFHRVADDSYTSTHMSRTPADFHESVLRRLRDLR